MSLVHAIFSDTLADSRGKVIWMVHHLCNSYITCVRGRMSSYRQSILEVVNEYTFGGISRTNWGLAITSGASLIVSVEYHSNYTLSVCPHSNC